MNLFTLPQVGPDPHTVKRQPTNMILLVTHAGRDTTRTESSAPKQAHHSEINSSLSHQQIRESNHATVAGAALEAALTRISDSGHVPGNKAPCDMSRTSKSTSRSVGPAAKTAVQQTDKAAQQALRLASTSRLEKEQAERAERIRAANL